jgi:hypothetical protein
VRAAFFTTIGICWLARQKPWQPIGALGETGRLCCSGCGWDLVGIDAAGLFDSRQRADDGRQRLPDVLARGSTSPWDGHPGLACFM